MNRKTTLLSFTLRKSLWPRWNPAISGVLRIVSVFVCCIVPTLVTFTCERTACAQAKKGFNVPAVDVISLKSGRSLRGLIAPHQNNNDLSIVVSREWFEAANHQAFNAALKQNLANQKSSWMLTCDRISERLKSPELGPHLKFFLEKERERLRTLMSEPNPQEPQFVWVDVRRETIAKVHPASPEGHRLVHLAWKSHLKNVETRDAASLRKELIEKGVDLESPPPDISSELPAREQGEQEWSARMALVDYAMTKPLDFQGMGDKVARVQAGKPVDLGEVLPGFLQQQVLSALGDLAADPVAAKKGTGTTGWMSEATRIAEREGVSGFRVTRVEISSNSSEVTVETMFVVKLPAANWRVIWSSRHSADTSKERPQTEAQIEQDPQLKSVVEVVQSLGLGNENLKRAIRTGAATMQAQREADGTFGEFKNQFLQRLDGPPLFLPGFTP